MQPPPPGRPPRPYLCKMTHSDVREDVSKCFKTYDGNISNRETVDIFRSTSFQTAIITADFLSPCAAMAETGPGFVGFGAACRVAAAVSTATGGRGSGGRAYARTELRFPSPRRRSLGTHENT